MWIRFPKSPMVSMWICIPINVPCRIMGYCLRRPWCFHRYLLCPNNIPCRFMGYWRPPWCLHGYLAVYAFPYQNPMENHGLSKWFFIRTPWVSGFPYEVPMENHDCQRYPMVKPWVFSFPYHHPMGVKHSPWYFHEYPWNSMDTPYNSMDIPWGISVRCVAKCALCVSESHGIGYLLGKYNANKVKQKFRKCDRPAYKKHSTHILCFIK
jgi:hypothetical protein